MRITRNGGTEDLESTSPRASLLPPDVRLPFRHFAVSEFTGRLSQSRDSEFCAIDNQPSFDIPRNWSDKGHMDGSRHYTYSSHHAWQAHPHAIRTVGDGVLNPERSSFPRPWVPDGTERDQYGKVVLRYRRIDVEEVTIPHDCSKHLPEGDA